MTTVNNKKCYPSEKYLNELITNIEFAARAPVEVVRAMAAELQKRREADSAEPASNHEELPLDYLQGQKDGLEWAAQLAEANHPQTGDWLYDDPLELAKAIRKGPDMPEFDGPTPITPEAIENAIDISAVSLFTSMKTITTASILRISCDKHWSGWKGIHAATTDRVKPRINQYAATRLPNPIAVMSGPAILILITPSSCSIA